MSDKRLLQALDDGLRALSVGGEREQVLGAFPELRARLEPLVDTVQSLRAGDAVGFPAWSKARLRDELMRSLPASPRSVARSRSSWSRRFVLAPILAGVLLALGLLFGLDATQAPRTDQDATLLTVLDGGVRIETAAGVLDGYNGAVLRPGDRIVTLDGAQAVLTFFDGSTVTLDGGTSVEIRSLQSVDGQLHVVLAQTQGSTWTHIPAPLGPAQVEIDTPSARVQTSEATFETTVKTDGATEIGSQAGSLAVQSGGQRAEVPGGFRASVESAGAAAATAEAQQPQNELYLLVSGKAFVYLTDPRGATVGIVAPGVPVNQVAGATVTQEAGQLVIRVADPAAGVYRLGLSAAAEAPASVVAGLSGEVNLTRRLDLAPGEEVSVDVALDSDTLTLLNLRREPAVKPERVVVPPTAIDRAVSNTAPALTGPSTSPTAPVPSRTPTATPTRTPSPKPTSTPTATPTPKARSTPSISPIEPVSIPDVTTDSAQPSR